MEIDIKGANESGGEVIVGVEEITNSEGGDIAGEEENVHH